MKTEKTPQDIKERSFSFAVEIVKICRSLDPKCVSSRNISYQLTKAGTSIGANLEEAHAGQSRSDFIHKLSIASKEAREAHYWLRILSAAEISSSQDLTPLIKEANEVVSILTAILRNTKANTSNSALS